MNLFTALKTQYDEKGIVCLRDFLSPSMLSGLIKELKLAEEAAQVDLEKKWNNKKITFYTKKQNSEKGEESVEPYVLEPYFQQSAHAAHLFFEEIEGDGDGKSVLNRMGHGLHLHEGIPTLQKQLYQNTFLNEWLKTIGYHHPICLLSVYIPKFPHGIGSEVRPHQESSFAHTSPLSSSVIWIALEDSTVENACLWGLMGSHRLPLKYLSKVDRINRTRRYELINDVTIPDFDLERQVYTPLEIKAGDALFFDGNFVHCSPRNTSTKSRKALSLQFIETQETKFSPFNWVQQPRSKPLF